MLAPRGALARKLFLGCGILASLLYVGTDVLAAVRYPTYHSFTARAVSELMARGAPTEHLVDPLFLIYGALMIAFGVGIWLSGTSRRMHLVGSLLVVYAALGLLGPTMFEMNVRGSGGSPRADLLHVVLTAVLVALMIAAVVVAAKLRGPTFRVYTYSTLVTMVVFGVLTACAMRGAARGAPTPWVGLLERVDIGAFLLWVVVLAVSLLRVRMPSDTHAPLPPSALPAY